MLNANGAVQMRRDAKVVAVNQTASSSGAGSKVTIDVGMAGQLRGSATISKSSVRLSDSTAASFAGLPTMDLASLAQSGCGSSGSGAAAWDDGEGSSSTYAGCQSGLQLMLS
jgi:hypothetical protein